MEQQSVGGRAHLGRVHALDGLTGLAVGGLVLRDAAAHTGRAWASGGFLGIDVLLVVAAFVLTARLLEEWEATGGVDLARCYLALAGRVGPALAVLAVGGDRWAAVLALAFLAVWPLVVGGALLAGLSSRSLAVLTGAAALATAAGGVARPGPAAHAAVPLVGATAAFAVLSRRRPWQPVVTDVHRAAVLAAIGLVALWATARPTDDATSRGGLLVTATAVALVIVSVATTPGTGLAAVLLSRPTRWLGHHALALYAWHLAVDALSAPGRIGVSGAPLLGVRLIAVAALAALSTRPLATPLHHAQAAAARTLRGHARRGVDLRSSVSGV